MRLKGLTSMPAQTNSDRWQQRRLHLNGSLGGARSGQAALYPAGYRPEDTSTGSAPLLRSATAARPTLGGAFFFFFPLSRPRPSPSEPGALHLTTPNAGIGYTIPNSRVAHSTTLSRIFDQKQVSVEFAAFYLNREAWAMSLAGKVNCAGR